MLFLREFIIYVYLSCIIFFYFFNLILCKKILEDYIKKMKMYKKISSDNMTTSEGKSKSIKQYSSNSLLKPILSRLRKPSYNDIVANPIQHSKILIEQRQRLSSY